ncbi:DUF3800 domain-containing protein [Nitrospirillum pindoramense]|uniref:DUF3800 domain-containing protein n=1 Tax=Nitrospirillum amazonense TaxID=28077 RepID=A0A560GVG8_9PROT|nr:DUF3800 domain-containing protein [Nitrospirillum amazonense]TWB38022.1 hypothetical protein FBZ90_11313 [Nitrospirillum amazonense]
MKTVYKSEEMLKMVAAKRNLFAPLKIFYDESENFRKVRLTENGFNVDISKAFVLAGIALQPGQAVPDEATVRSKLMMQSNMAEIKFEYVANGTYENILKSRKLEAFLRHLVDHKIIIHYSVVDMLHWTLVDIIDNTVGPHWELKNELFRAAIQSNGKIIDLLYRYEFPVILEGKTRTFLSELREILSGLQQYPQNSDAFLLLSTLDMIIENPDVEDCLYSTGTKYEVVGGLSSHYFHCVYKFPKATHLFDREVEVEDALSGVEVQESGNPVQFSFHDSTSEFGIQIADVIAGLFSKHFTYLRSLPISEIRRRKLKFFSTQNRNLALMKKLIDYSDAISDGTCHAILPLDTVRKNNLFLHDIDPPEMYDEFVYAKGP